MEGFENDGQKSGVDWHTIDEEALETSCNTVTHTQITSSQISIPSVHSRKGSIDPATMLAILYLKVSFNLDEPRKKILADAKTAKDSTTAELFRLEWHVLSRKEVSRRLSTSVVKGLNEEEVNVRLVEYGRNTPSAPHIHRSKQIFRYLYKRVGSILPLGSTLIFVCWKPIRDPSIQANFALGIVLLAVFFIQAAFNAWQDWSSFRVMASITNMMPENCLLLAQATTAASAIVPGGLLLIKARNKLPADVRFVEVFSDAKFDRFIPTGRASYYRGSSTTDGLVGEFLPLSGTVDSTDDNYLETKCIGMLGTNCVSGSGLGIVVATGDRTVF